MTKTRNSGINFDALTDLFLVILVLVTVKQSVLSVSMLYAGPAATFSAMIAATLLLRRRKMSWGELGFKWPQSWLRTLGLTILTFIAFIVTVIIFSFVADKFFVDVGASGRFDHVEGNLVAYIIIMCIVWTHGSVFEELLFRAFIISKTSLFMGGGKWADLMAVVLAGIFFGYRHYYYQGYHGALMTGGIGVTFGLLYLWFGRKNILPIIFVHGFVNSVAQTARFLGVTD